MPAPTPPPAPNPPTSAEPAAALPGFEPPPGLDPDRHRLLQALAVVQSPVTANRLAELLAAGQWRTTRGSGFHASTLRPWLQELRAAGLADTDGQGHWQAHPAAAWAALLAIVDEPAERARWWAAWRAWMQFDHGWHLRLMRPEDLVGAVRTVVFVGGRREDFDRLCRMSTAPSPRQPTTLAQALLSPFDAARWSAIDPELRLPLLEGLLDLARGDHETITAPLWQWLRDEAAATGPEALHDFARLALAEHLLLCGEAAAATALVQGMDHTQAEAVRACALIVQGRWDEGATAFEAAWKARSAATGKRKQLMPEALTWLYALALLARPQPAQWAAARKFVAAEAGRREAEPHTFWGIWQAAIDQRLGDAPRSVQPFRLTPPGPWQGRLPGLQQVAHLVLAAWLGHAAPDPQALAAWCDRLAADYRAGGQHWLAGLVRRADAQLRGVPPAAGDAAQPFPVAAPTERWREALNAIVALGPVGGGADEPREAGGHLVWCLGAYPGGRVRSIEPMQQTHGPRGKARPKPVALATLAKRTDLPAHDAAVLRAVRRPAYGGPRLVLDPAQALPALVGHPHLAWATAPSEPITLVESLPRLEVLTDGEQVQFKLLDPVLPDELRAADGRDAADDEDSWRWRQGEAEPAPLRLLRDGPRQARLLRITPAQQRVAELVRQGWRVPASARTELDAALRVLVTHFQLASDAEAGEEIEASGVLHAELTPQAAGLQLRLVALPFGALGDVGPRLPPGIGRPRVTTVHDGRTLSTRRDLDAERAGRARLLAAAPFLDDLGPAAHEWSLDDPEEALALVEALGRLAPGIVSEWPSGKRLRVRPVAAAQVTLKVKRTRDWLALDGQVQVDSDEVLRLEDLLKLLPAGQRRFVALGDGDFLALGDVLRQQLADLRALAQAASGGGLRLSPAAALAWSAQPDAPPLEGDATWAARCAAWAEAAAERPALPAGLQAELRDYQREGWHWLMRLAGSGFGAVLADDMGLGKTLQTLAVLAARAAGGPALVVAPTSVCGNWLAEAARFTPGLNVALYGARAGGAADDEGDGEDDEASADPGDPAAGRADAGADDASAAGASGADATPAATSATTAATDAPAAPDNARRAARQRQLQALGPGDLLVISYGLLQGDADLLASRPWHTVVLDEAQAVKNAATRRAKAAQALRGDFRLALTGTPVENRLGELWAIMAFANPGLLGSAEQFQQRFAGPIERDADAESRRRLRRLIAPFVLRRTKAEVLADLPPRTEIVHEVVPSHRERAFHEALRRQAEAQVTEVLTAGTGQAREQAVHILAALTRLRRAACDPRLVAPALGLAGAKLDAFEALARELVAGRHKALVFSQFTDFLALLRERLDAAGLRYQYLDGSTPAAQRTQRVAAFQGGEGDFFLISLKAGGFGLNLTMADYVVIADPWWNPAAEDQATGRAHRIGQTRPVTVYRLVTRGSIEERIVALHQHKRELADGVLAAGDGAEAAGAPLDAAALLALLRGEPA